MSYELHGPFGVTLLRPSCEIILGRSRKGTARLDDPYASGQHLKLGVSSTGVCHLELLGHNGACAAL